MEHVVLKHNGTYTLYVYSPAHRLIERVTAHRAQLISDYLWRNWPVGTRVKWVVCP